MKFRYKFLSVLVLLMLACSCSFCINAGAVGVSAKSAIVIDADTGEIIYGKNESEKLPMASTTKIMSTLIVLEQGNLDEEFVVDADAIKVEGSSMGLKEGYKVTLKKLCYGMMLPSGNDAANAAAVRVSGSVDKFVDLMNERAEEIGLKNTHFVTPSGLDDYTDDHYSTAYDMAVLMKTALKNETFREIIGTKKTTVDFGNGKTNYLVNSNKLWSYCDGIIGGKTGFTDKAKRCLVSACERDDTTLICVTLNAPDDWNDQTTLYDQCFLKYKSVSLMPSADTFKLPVVGGSVSFVEAECKNVKKGVLGGDISSVSQNIVILPFYYAPVKDGDVLGEVRFQKNGEVIAVSPITAVSDVTKSNETLGFLDRIELFFKNLF